MRDFEERKVFTQRSFKVWLYSLSLFIFCSFFSKSASGQHYIDVPLQMDFYRTNSADLDFSRRGVIVNPTIGFTITDFDSSRFELSNGFGVYYSKFNQNAGDDSFYYQRVGIINYNIQAYYQLLQNVKVGFGGSVGVYGTILGNLFKIDIDDTSDKDDRLGKGFRPYNLGNFLEVRYSFSSLFSLGTKFTYWYIPQLKYRTVSELGEFSDYKTDLFTSRLEFSLRFDLNR